jgi:pimeloyl-ACP methyl ester carboxylesterase
MAIPTIEPILFGPDHRPLFGIFHPHSGPGISTLTVICEPLFAEYMRTHSALRELALLLSERGHDVLRFDYSGTGDSGGDMDEIELSDWLHDIELAVDEGLGISGATHVNIIGVRAGALLACRALASRRNIRILILWDAIPDGAVYMADQKIKQKRLIAEAPVAAADYRVAAEEYAGCRLSDGLVRNFSALGAETYSMLKANAAHVIATTGVAPVPVPNDQLATLPFDCDWNNDTEDQLMPRIVVEHIVQCLCGK